MPDAFVDKDIREQFFNELRELVGRYPSLANRMARGYEECLLSHDHDDGEYDPKSPTFLQGIVLLVSHTNMDHYEDMSVLDPMEQSAYLTRGMLHAALNILD
jgi:hypothetical protein